jgi:hypothetical protein
VDESHICNAELYANAKQESGQWALMAAWHQYIMMKEMTIKERMHQQLTTAGGQHGVTPSQPVPHGNPLSRLMPDQNAQIQNAVLTMQASGQLLMSTSALAAVTQQLQQSSMIPVYNGQMPQSAVHLKKLAQMPMLALQQRAGFNISQISQMTVNASTTYSIIQLLPSLSPTSMCPPTPSVSPADLSSGLTQNSPTHLPSQIMQ